jgi:peptide-methionine (R)-S-oxide reductase
MKNHLQGQPETTHQTEPAGASRLTRRAFFATAAGACGAAFLWSLHRPSIAAAEPRDGGSTPATVTIVEFSANGKKTGKITVPHIVKSDAEWRQQLSGISYQVTRRAGTERAYTGSTWDLHDRGIFRCVCCDTAVFSSDTKFDSGTGWPSFWQPIAHENIVETTDRSLLEERTAVSCRRCDAHLGHVFDDGPRPTGLRYCMNSAAMTFVKLA